MTYMMDVRNNRIYVGNSVAFIKNVTRDATIDTGIVTKIYKNEKTNEYECSVKDKEGNIHTHIYSNRLFKIMQIA